MAISLNSVKRSGTPRPTIDMIYAPQGMGKTTLAAGAPGPIFLQTEDGLGKLESSTFGVLKTYEDVVDAIKVLATQDHEFNTAVLDSATWLQPLIWDAVCKANGWANIEAAGYGKGPIAADNYWRVILDGLRYLRDVKNMGVIILAHATVKKQELPDSEDFDRYQPSLHQRATDMLQQYCDDVLFINTRVSVTRSIPKDVNSRGLAVGSNQRFIYPNLKPAHMAKNRFDMPDMIPLPSPPAGQAPEPFTLFAALARYIPYYQGLLSGSISLPSVVKSSDTEAVQSAAESPQLQNPFHGLGEPINATGQTEPETSETETETDNTATV